jgi:PKD repeat protein
MKKFILILIVFVVTSQQLISQNAPISTVGTIVSAGTTAIVPITAINFVNIGSCDLELLYDPTIALATSVTTGSLLGGNIATNLTSPGTIILGWYTYPGVTLPDNSVIFNISFTKVTNGTSAITFYDDGHSCTWYDGSWNRLNDFPNSTYYLNGSLTFTGTPLVANFIANDTVPPKNTTVQFTDLTTGSPTGWNWSFDRASSVVYVNGTNANSQNPQVQFTVGGPYTVTLYAYNVSYHDTKIKPGYIVAGTPGLWDGTTSTDWNTTTNWDNWVIPLSSTNVVIPSSAPYWPVLNTNLILGVNCNSITMNGASQATVTGDFTLNAATSLSITSNGLLQVGGNWTNSGSFTAGTGTIEFIGSNPSTILSGVTPNVFYNLKISKTPSGSWTNPIGITITVNGAMTINQ